MRLVLTSLAIIGLGASTMAADMTARPSFSGTVASNATAIVTNRTRTTGKVVSLSCGSSGGSATVTVYTVAGQGTSLNTAKTIFPAAVVAPSGVVTNFAASIYLYDDLIVYRTDNAANTASVSTAAMVLIE